MALSLADGQLAASTATILPAGTDERTVAVMLFNTTSQSQAVTLTVTRASSSARTIARVTLAEKYESAYVVGIPLDPSDVLSGYTTYASSVDYVVTASTGAFNIIVRDADGSPKASADVELQTSEKASLTIDGVVMSGYLEEIRDVLLKIASA